MIRIEPDSPSADVTVAVTHNLPCTVDGAICTVDGRQLSNRLEHTVAGLVPAVPDTLTGAAVLLDRVDLEWSDGPRASSYEVQLLHSDHWEDLPANGVEIVFDGSAAVISGLPVGVAHSFRVRAVNAHGASEWSAHWSTTIKVVLESTLTAGRQTDILPVPVGYSFFGPLGGTLAPARFESDGTSYTIRFLAHLSESLWLGLDRELPTDFTLRVGEAAYLGSESLVPNASGVGYWWPVASSAGLGDAPVRVELILQPGVALGDREKAPVTGYFQGFPPDYGPNEAVSFRLYFSEGVATTADALRNEGLAVSGGVIASVEAAGTDGRIWAVSVTPESREAVTVRLDADLACAQPGAICTADGRRLFNDLELTVAGQEWHAPEGVPTIRGTAQAGETLTADTAGISDADGMTGATFRYQWVSYAANAATVIPGATDSTYTLVPGDEGKAFKVEVSFTDDAGYQETVTSALVHSERPYGLTASSADGAVALTWRLPALWPFTSTYQILRNRPELGESEPLVHVRYTRAGGPAYIDSAVEPGVLYVYRVKGVDLLGLTHEASAPVAIRTPHSTPVVNRPARGAPHITGPAVVGETLTVDTSAITDADGLTNAPFRYRWISRARAGATGATYTLRAADVGQSVQVRVSFTDAAGHAEALTSEPTPVVRAPLTATVHAAPARHDGQTAFTFELRFSEELPLSYRTLRDAAFRVTGGTVTAARRLAPPHNLRWEITVAPRSVGPVTVTLPAPRDCAAPGAICTATGRRLSAAAGLLVAGPSSSRPVE